MISVRGQSGENVLTMFQILPGFEGSKENQRFELLLLQIGLPESADQVFQAVDECAEFFTVLAGGTETIVPVDENRLRFGEKLEKSILGLCQDEAGEIGGQARPLVLGKCCWAQFCHEQLDLCLAGQRCSTAVDCESEAVQPILETIIHSVLMVVGLNVRQIC